MAATQEPKSCTQPEYQTPTWRRTRLIDAACRAIESGPSHLTIQAPTGYGKTVLLHGIGSELPNQALSIYVSMPSCEGAPALFIDALIAAIRHASPSANLRPLLMFKKAGLGPELVQRPVYALARTLNGSGVGPAVIALDDLHGVTPDSPLYALIVSLMRGSAGRVSWVLASREDLSQLLPAADLKSTLELRAQDLAYTLDELETYLSLQVDSRPSPDALHRLMSKTGGWPLAVSAVAHDYLNGKSAVHVTSSIESLGYIVDTVMACLPSPTRYVLQVLSTLQPVDIAGAIRVLTGHQGQAPPLAPGRRLITLNISAVRQQLDYLVSCQVLRASGEGYALNPALREGLQRRFKAEHPRAFHEAHRRAASHCASKGGRERQLVDHLLGGERWQEALIEAEQWVDELALTRDHETLLRWLTTLEAHVTPLPLWALHALASLMIERGLWSDARRSLARCQAMLQREADPSLIARWRPKLYLTHAHLCARRGNVREAVTFCKRGLDFLRQHQRRKGLHQNDRDPRVELEITTTLASLKYELGALEQASLTARRALELAETRVCFRAQAEATAMLGRVARTRGELVEALERLYEAKRIAERSSDVALTSLCSFELGVTHCLVGDWSRGLQSMERHLAVLNDAGDASVLLQACGVAGLLRLQAGDIAGAQASFALGERVASRVVGPTVSAAFFERKSILCARLGLLPAARTNRSKAVMLGKKLKRPEFELLLLRAEARAELLAADGQFELARQSLEGTIEQVGRVGAQVHLAQYLWRTAYWAHRSFLDEAIESPATSHDLATRASILAERLGLRLAPVGLDEEFLHLGFALGDAPLRGLCRQLLAHHEGDAVEGGAWGIGALSEGTLERYRYYRQAANLSTDFTVSSRHERRAANAREVQGLAEDVSPGQLILNVPEQLLYLGTQRTSLQEKRVILPLLLHFLHHADQRFSMEDLARDVWGAKDGHEKMKTKVKVAVSRLRGLLGECSSYIQTVRVPQPDGGTVAGYQLDSSVEFWVIEHATDSTF